MQEVALLHTKFWPWDWFQPTGVTSSLLDHEVRAVGQTSSLEQTGRKRIRIELVRPRDRKTRVIEVIRIARVEGRLRQAKRWTEVDRNGPTPFVSRIGRSPNERPVAEVSVCEERACKEALGHVLAGTASVHLEAAISRSIRRRPVRRRKVVSTWGGQTKARRLGENFSPTSVHERPNTGESRGVTETREQDESTT